MLHLVLCYILTDVLPEFTASFVSLMSDEIILVRRRENLKSHIVHLCGEASEYSLPLWWRKHTSETSVSPRLHGTTPQTTSIFIVMMNLWTHKLQRISLLAQWFLSLPRRTAFCGVPYVALYQAHNTPLSEIAVISAQWVYTVGVTSFRATKVLTAGSRVFVPYVNGIL